MSRPPPQDAPIAPRRLPPASHRPQASRRATQLQSFHGKRAADLSLPAGPSVRRAKTPVRTTQGANLPPTQWVHSPTGWNAGFPLRPSRKAMAVGNPSRRHRHARRPRHDAPSPSTASTSDPSASGSSATSPSRHTPHSCPASPCQSDKQSLRLLLHPQPQASKEPTPQPPTRPRRRHAHHLNLSRRRPDPPSCQHHAHARPPTAPPCKAVHPQHPGNCIINETHHQRGHQSLSPLHRPAPPSLPPRPHPIP